MIRKGQPEKERRDSRKVVGLQARWSEWRRAERRGRGRESNDKDEDKQQGLVWGTGWVKKKKTGNKRRRRKRNWKGKEIIPFSHKDGRRRKNVFPKNKQPVVDEERDPRPRTCFCWREEGKKKDVMWMREERLDAGKDALRLITSWLKSHDVVKDKEGKSKALENRD